MTQGTTLKDGKTPAIFLCRADNYYNNTGVLVGFYDTLEKALNDLATTGKQISELETEDYCQVTVFAVAKKAYEAITDEAEMMTLWEDGEIFLTSYYEMEKH